MTKDYRLLFSLVPLWSFAQGFVPALTNYNAIDYSAGMQNWDIAQDASGRMYFGNSTGLLMFDGYNWELQSLPGHQILRSLLCDDDRIYVGLYEDMGYMETDEYGKWHFNSLVPLLGEYTFHNDEVWNILKTKDGRIIFQTFCSWFEYDGKELRVHYDGKWLPLYFFQVRDEIYAQRMDQGFYRLEGDNFELLFQRELIGDDNVVSAMPYGKDGLLLCTEFHGLFTYANGRLSRINTQADKELRQVQANRAILSSDGQTIVVGTIIGGIYGISMSGELLWHYDTSNLLGNNTVLRLHVDKTGNIWAALDIGIALIHIGSPYTLLSGNLGLVYDVYVKDDGNMLIATNQNTLFYNNGSVWPVEGTEGQNWHIAKLGNQLIAGSNNGARVIEGLKSHIVDGSTSGSSTAIRHYAISDERDYLIESSYVNLRIYRNIGGNWVFQNNVDSFMAPVAQLEIDKRGVIWAGNMNKGCYRIELTPDMKRISKMQFYESPREGGDNSKLHVMKIRGDIVLSDGDALYLVKDEDGATQIQPFTELNDIVGPGVVSSTPVDNNSFWLSLSQGYSLITYSEGKYFQKLYVPARFFGLSCGDLFNNVRIFGNYSYFCLNRGVGRMDMTAEMSGNWGRGLTLRSVSYLSSGLKSVPMPIGKGRATAKGDVRLVLSYPNYNNAPLLYEFRLTGGGDRQTYSSTTPETVLSRLGYGDYDLTCRVYDENHNVLDSLDYHFSHPRPLHLSIPAIIAYIIVLTLLVWLLIKWRTSRSVAKNRMEMQLEQIKHDLQLSEQQRMMESQQKMLIEQQLQLKGKEMASMAISATRTAYSSKENEYWSIFQENFDLIHKQFFRRLRERWPSLTATDLKFCALLRLNLSTKEIASFTGLTVRGVEGARLRLRKKFGLGGDTDLTSFLIDF